MNQICIPLTHCQHFPVWIVISFPFWILRPHLVTVTTTCFGPTRKSSPSPFRNFSGWVVFNHFIISHLCGKEPLTCQLWFSFFSFSLCSNLGSISFPYRVRFDLALVKTLTLVKTFPPKYYGKRLYFSR